MSTLAPQNTKETDFGHIPLKTVGPDVTCPALECHITDEASRGLSVLVILKTFGLPWDFRAETVNLIS